MHSITKYRRTKGFTLVELMIVVVIVGLLASVAIVAYNKHLHAGYVVHGQTFISQIASRQETYFQENGQYLNVSGTPLIWLDGEPFAFLRNIEYSVYAWVQRWNRGERPVLFTMSGHDLWRVVRVVPDADGNLVVDVVEVVNRPGN